MSETKKKSNYRFRLTLLYIGSFVSSIAPLFACLIVNWSKYAKTPNETVKLCIGGIIAMFFLFLKVIGKLKMPRRIVLFGVVFIMAYLMQAILDDLVLLSGMALAGELVDYIFFQRIIRNTKEKILINKTADVTATQVEEVLKKYAGRI